MQKEIEELVRAHKRGENVTVKVDADGEVTLSCCGEFVKFNYRQEWLQSYVHAALVGLHECQIIRDPIDARYSLDGYLPGWSFLIARNSLVVYRLNNDWAYLFDLDDYLNRTARDLRAGFVRFVHDVIKRREEAQR